MAIWKIIYILLFSKSIIRALIINNVAYLICIAATEEKFDLLYRRKTLNNKDGVEITCLAEGLYPQPTLDISIE